MKKKLFKINKNCRLCSSKKIYKVVDIGSTPISEKYSPKKNSYTIDDIADEPGWSEVRQALISNTGTNSIPVIGVVDVEPGCVLVLQHDHDGRDLELTYAERVVKNISTLWEGVVKLHTIIEEEPWEI